MDISENIAKETTIEDVAIAPPGPTNTDTQHTQLEEPSGMLEGEASLNEGGDDGKDEDEDEEMDYSGSSARHSEDRSDTESTSNSSDYQSSDEDDGALLPEQPSNDHKFLISPQREYGAGRFADDLKDALSGNLEATSDTFHFERLGSAPNPLLSIDGLGTIGIPVSPRDVDALSELAVKASEIEVRSPGANTYSIESSKVGFGNPQWTRTIHAKMTQTVWAGLGLPSYVAPAQCTLQKIVIIKPGPVCVTDFSGEDNKMFAYVVVQLPSPHLGGHAQVIRKTGTQRIGLAEQPLTTSILAFYGGTNIPSDSITEGYRVALVYGLATVTSPDLPINAPMAHKLGRVFTKWTKKGYTKASPKQQYAYVLDQTTEAPSQNRKRQSMQLTPRDKEVVSCLRTVAQKFGYVVFTGKLSYWEPPEPDYDDSESDRAIDDGYDEKPTGHFEDMAGADGVVLGFRASKYVDIKRIVPFNFFKVLQRAGYQGGMYEGLSRRAVLIVPAKDEDDILCKADENYWLSRLEALDPDAGDALDPRGIKTLLSYVESASQSYYTQKRDDKAGTRLIKLALKWKDLDLWSKTMETRNKTLDAYKVKEILEAWRVFTFERLVTVFDAALPKVPATRRLACLKLLESNAPSEDRQAVTSWVSEQYRKAITSEESAGSQVYDIFDIITVGKERGARFLAATLLPHYLEHPPNITFIEDLYTHLRGNASSIPDAVLSTTATTDSQINSLNEFLRALLNNALKMPKHQLYGVSWINPIPLERQERIFPRLKSVIKLRLLYKDYSGCALPLRLILHTNPIDYDGVMNIYGQLFEEFRALLTRHNKTMTTTPFQQFFATVIGLRLQPLLDWPRPVGEVNLPFGCKECDHCIQINRFLNTREELSFRYPERILAEDRRHLEPALNELRRRGLAEYNIGPEPWHKAKNFLSITNKHISLRSTEEWDKGADSAKKYLSTIGSDAEIATLMGDDFPKIQAALRGEKAYTMSPRFKDSLGEVTRASLELPEEYPSLMSPFGDRSNLGRPAGLVAYRERQKRKQETEATGDQVPKRARET